MKLTLKTVKWPASVVFMCLISQAVHIGGAFLGMKYYMDPQYFPVWSKIMMPQPGPPPPSFTALTFLFALVAFSFFAWFYSIVRKSLPGRNAVRRGLVFGLLVSMMATVPGMLSISLFVNLPFGLTAMWAAECLIINLLNGVLVARING